MRKWQIKGKKGALGVNIGVSRRGGNYYYEGSQGGLDRYIGPYWI